MMTIHHGKSRQARRLVVDLGETAGLEVVVAMILYVLTRSQPEKRSERRGRNVAEAVQPL
jgi:hypothetical protein